MADGDVLTAKEIFRRAQAIITDDHFVYAKKSDGWYHGPDYVNKDAIYVRPSFVSLLCQSLAMFFRERAIDVVVGPTVGAVNLATWTAHWLSTIAQLRTSEVEAIFSDEEDVLEGLEVTIGSLSLLPDGRYETSFPSFGLVTII